MASELFGIDEIDRNIIQLIQKEPTLTHTEIAKKVNRSQPTIGMRIRKLEELGILKFQAGVNFKTTDLILARAEIQTLNPSEIIKLVEKCPYMLNAFRLSGASNLSILMASPKLKDLDQIVNRHFRKNPAVLSVNINVITEIIEDFVLNFNFNFDKCGATKDGRCCGKCINQS
ncbi:MAG: Lrp/AsnC family transcriptional regulator [Candidatus Odinarchaeota archaeon]